MALLLLAACTHKPEAVPLREAVKAPGKVHVIDAPADQEGDTGWWPTVLFDKRSVAHLAFCDAHHGDVRYTTEVAGMWKTTSIFSQGAVGKYISMDTDANNRLGLMYYDQDKRYLHYASQVAADGAWQDERVAWGRELGIGSSLRFDADNTPHMFYYLPAGNLIHASKKVGMTEWSKDQVAEVQGVYSMRTSAKTRDDGIWLSYVDWKMRDAALYLGHLGTNGWETSVVNADHGPGWRSQLVYLNDAPWVVHSAELTKQTNLSERTAQGNWVTRPLVAHGSSFAATTWNGKLVVAYQDTGDEKTGAQVRYTVQQPAGVAWPVYTVDASSPCGGYIAAAVSPKGRLLIAYYADAERSLKLYDEQLEN